MKNRNEAQVLISELTNELHKIEQIYQDLKNQVSLRSTRERVESMALRMHNIYTGLERIFQLIAHDLNGKVPEGFDWHRQLLHQMSLDLANIRPPLIKNENLPFLRDLLAFRHVVRYSYGFELDPQKVKTLAKETIQKYPKVKEDLETFVEFLKTLNNEI